MIKANKSLPAKPAILTGNMKLAKKVWECRELYLFLFLGIVTTIVFSYGPMYGLLMAFQDAKIGTIIGQAEWLGLYHFDKFFNGIWFKDTLWNTVKFSLAGNFLYWPAALALALMLHNSTNDKLKKAAQNLTYIPHMLSIIVVFSVLNLFIHPQSGLINILLGTNTDFYYVPEAIMPIYLITGIWQNTGYSAIVYIGALSSVDEETVEAARIDGASKWRIIWNVQIPTIMPTVITMLIMNLGQVFSVGTEKIMMIQNDINVRQTKTIGVYVFEQTKEAARYGFTTAVSMFQNVINLLMMFIINWLGDKIAGISVI